MMGSPGDEKRFRPWRPGGLGAWVRILMSCVALSLSVPICSVGGVASQEAAGLGRSKSDTQQASLIRRGLPVAVTIAVTPAESELHSRPARTCPRPRGLPGWGGNRRAARGDLAG